MGGSIIRFIMRMRREESQKLKVKSQKWVTVFQINEFGILNKLKTMTIWKFILFLLLLPAFCSAQANDPKDIIKAFKDKNVPKIVSYSAFPFKIEVGSTEDNKAILDKDILERKLKKLFSSNYFDVLLNGKQIIDKKDEIIFESRTYNPKGELESESTLIFKLKKNKNKKWVLYELILAG